MLKYALKNSWVPRFWSFAPFQCQIRYASTKLSSKKIVLPKFSTVSHLATLFKRPLVQVQETMENMGFSQTHWDFIIDDENAVLVADELGVGAELNTDHGEDLYPVNVSNEVELKRRPPVIALMGHVDHGKTTLLDFFRKSHIVDGEKGGITQHIGAFLTKMGSEQVCFLDTPGHEAFLKLRQRGAHLTDVVLLVVAADDSVMPQTKEAIRHAKAANVPLIAALTKCDKTEAKPEQVVADLAGAGLDVEDYGGEVQCIPVSAVSGKGIPDLIAALQAQIEIADLKAPYDNFECEGVVVEASIAKGVGPAASIIVKKGILKPKQVVVAGTAWCRIRQLTNERGKALKEATPGTPVRITGWKSLPEPGDTVLQASDESQAKRVVENRKRLLSQAMEAKNIAIINENKEAQSADAQERAAREERAVLGLEGPSSDSKEFFSVSTEPGQSSPRIINYVVKADVAGSAEAVTDIISQLGNDEIQANVLFNGIGEVTENDIFRAKTADASIIAFSLPVSRQTERLAEQQKVLLKKFDVIYKTMEDISAFLSSQLQPIITRKVVAKMEIRAIFSITLKKKAKLNVAGVKVGRGQFTASTPVQVLRKEKKIWEGTLSSIQHGKEHVSEAHKGSEYGITFANWTEFQEGDIIEGYEEIRTPRYI